MSNKNFGDSLKDRRSYRVLLVEDDDDDYLLISQWLKQARWLDLAVDRVSSYADAKKYLSLKRPDMILSNYQLGGSRTGLDLANWLWARSDQIPMLLLSGTDIRGEISPERLHKVVIDFLPKSLLSAELLELNISRVMRV